MDELNSPLETPTNYSKQSNEFRYYFATPGLISIVILLGLIMRLFFIIYGQPGLVIENVAARLTQVQNPRTIAWTLPLIQQLSIPGPVILTINFLIHLISLLLLSRLGKIITTPDSRLFWLIVFATAPLAVVSAGNFLLFDLILLIQICIILPFARFFYTSGNNLKSLTAAAILLAITSADFVMLPVLVIIIVIILKNQHQLSGSNAIWPLILAAVSILANIISAPGSAWWSQLLSLEFNWQLSLGLGLVLFTPAGLLLAVYSVTKPAAIPLTGFLLSLPFLGFGFPQNLSVAELAALLFLPLSIAAAWGFGIFLERKSGYQSFQIWLTSILLLFLFSSVITTWYLDQRDIPEPLILKQTALELKSRISDSQVILISNHQHSFKFHFQPENSIWRSIKEINREELSNILRESVNISHIILYGVEQFPETIYQEMDFFNAVKIHGLLSDTVESNLISLKSNIRISSDSTANEQSIKRIMDFLLINFELVSVKNNLLIFKTAI